MRQGQQNRRGRGRNRKGHQNPLTRSFESTGPDVKIRGTPAHIAEKYMSLARDAQSSGDPVLAENYLQHAEHYNRIIMAFREQNVQQSGEAMNGGLQHRSMDGVEGDDYSDDEGDDLLPESYSQPSVSQDYQPRSNDGPQRRFGDRPPRQYNDQGRPHRSHDQGRPMRDHDQARSTRDQDQGRPVRDQDQGRPVRDRYPQDQRGAGNVERERPQPPVVEAAAPPEASPPPTASPPPAAPPRNEGGPRRRERFAPTHEQPEFLRRPVRRPRREANGSDTSEANGAAEPGDPGNQDKNSA